MAEAKRPLELAQSRGVGPIGERDLLVFVRTQEAAGSAIPADYPCRC